ncbi:FecR family protein [Alsobacter sp. R-9]
MRTGNAGRLQTKLSDDTRLTLGPASALTIDVYVFDPNKSENKMLVRALRGGFLFVGGKTENGAGSRVEIKTPLATLGVRGTRFLVAPIKPPTATPDPRTVRPGGPGQAPDLRGVPTFRTGMGVYVFEGIVDVNAPLGRATLRAGQGLILRQGEAPGPITQWTPDMIARALDSIGLTSEKVENTDPDTTGSFNGNRSTNGQPPSFPLRQEGRRFDLPNPYAVRPAGLNLNFNQSAVGIPLTTPAALRQCNTAAVTTPTLAACPQN